MAITGQKTVTAAGTAERLSSTQPVAEGGLVVIWPLVANTDSVYLGDSAAGAATGVGFELDNGSTYPAVFEVLDLNQIYVDVAVNGEGVQWYITKT